MMKFESLVEIERKIKDKLSQAYKKREQLINEAIEEGTNEANKIHEEADILIAKKLQDKKDKLLETDQKLLNVVKKKEEKITNLVKGKTDGIVEEIFKEALNDD